jgi:hypothetical protein
MERCDRFTLTGSRCELGKDHDGFIAAQTLLEHTRRIQFKQEILGCPDCDDNGLIDIGDIVERCPNHDWTVTNA